MFGEWTETGRLPATLNYEISIMWETKPWTIPQKTSRLSMEPEYSHEALKPVSCMTI
jgi:hypothetical protein